MLKQVQHDEMVRLLSFVIPNQVLNLIQDLRIRDLSLGFQIGRAFLSGKRIFTETGKSRLSFHLSPQLF